MFRNPKTSLVPSSRSIPHAPPSIEDLLRDANQSIGEGSDARTLALAIEANQQVMELYDALIDNLDGQDDEVVTVQANGLTVKFPDIDKVTNFVARWKEWQ